MKSRRSLPSPPVESAEQLRLIIDHVPVLIARIDCEQRYTFVNQPYAARYRLEPQDLIGRKISEIVGVGPYETARPKIEAALAGETMVFEIEIDYHLAHLGKTWNQVTFTPERAPDGTVIGLIAAFLDITLRKQAEHNLEESRDQALAGTRAKDEFLAALSHELRTPLNPVLLLASDAAANPNLTAEVRADFDAIRKNIEVEVRLIDDLLDLSQIKRGQLPLELRAMDIHGALRHAIDIVRPELTAKHLALDLALDPGEPTVWGDEVRLQQVFWNVLKNAVKFTPDSGRITVRTQIDPLKGRVVVKFIDTGIGLSADEQKHIFDSFTKGEHAAPGMENRFGGLGLGLAISRMLVELHSGHIEAKSAGRDRGAEFMIELPLHQASVRRDTSGPAWPLTSAPLVAPAKSAPARRLRLLLVEDHAPTRNTLAQLLGRRNYDVLAAASVAEARILGAGDFAFVISDIGLPDGDGYGLMAELRLLHPGLSGIAISGYGMEEDITRSRAAGFAQHLIKPVNIAALEAAIAGLSEARSASAKN